MCRKIIDSTGKWHMPRLKSAFKGTLRYASLNAIVTHQCGPSDDMMGWIYSIVRFQNTSDKMMISEFDNNIFN